MFKGSIVALVTPMRENASIDEVALRDLVDWHVSSGTHGLVIMGTTGESSLVSEDEHIEAVKIAIEQAKGRLKIIAGCGSASTAKAVELVERLNLLKPDGFLCVTPYYVKPTQKGLIQHFRVVADACKAPLILYNVPGRTCCDLQNDTIVTLSNHNNIVGVKDATGEIDRLTELMAALGDGFCYLSGDDETAFEFMLQGGHGVITVTGNVAPTEVSRWCELLLLRSPQTIQEAEVIFERLACLNQVLFIEANPIPVKWALAQMNKLVESIRLPLTSPEEASKIEIKKALKKSAISW